MKTLGEIGELEALKRLSRFFPDASDGARGRAFQPAHGMTLCGPGDDCAIVRAESCSSCDLLLTADPVIEGVHFTPDTPASAIGHKAVARSLSDIAAMGGIPMWAMIDIVAPGGMPISKLEALYEGAARLAGRFGLVIVGGDLAQGPILELHVAAVGQAPADSAVRRSTAQPDDLIFVTGSLGGSRGGRHLDFLPRVAEGTLLRDWASSMIDLSDGLATDLGHVADQSRVGALVFAQDIPISEAATQAWDQRTPLVHALTDGEDYELLFTLPPAKRDDFMIHWTDTFNLACTAIGVITDGDDVRLQDSGGGITPLAPMGYAHWGPQP